VNRKKTVVIKESGMEFGPFDEEVFFHIEKSGLYQHVNSGGGVSAAEFLLLRCKTPSSAEASSLWVVEAKSSSPRPESNIRFREFIEEIKSKLHDSLCLAIAALMGRHASRCDLPERFHEQDWSSIGIKLVLVINGHDKKWLEPVSDALQKTFKPIAMIWGFSSGDVVVINDEMGVRHGLVRKE